MSDDKVKALEFVEDIISRMSECSLKCKEFCILVISALLAIFASVEKHPPLLLFICCVPIIVFWFMDAFYLQEERLYRRLYSEKINSETEKNIMSLEIKRSWKEILRCLYSVSIIPVYGSLLLCAIVFGCLLTNGVIYL